MEKNFLEQLEYFPLRKIKNNIKIGVIAGGISSEREVSLSTGKGIHEALLKLGYKSEFIDFNGDITVILKKIDIAFLALHGKYGEDGTMQGLLELLKIPYTGSGVLSSAVAMDKVYSKKFFDLENIPTPPYLAPDLNCKEQMDTIAKKVEDCIGYPLIVKPCRGGSSIGVTIVRDKKNLKAALDDAAIQDSRVLIEKFVDGKLLTVSIIGLVPQALPIIEIRPKSGFYDYESKYTPGFTEYIVPAPIDKNLAKRISDFAIRCHNALDCSAVSRVDFIHGNDGSINVLEVNTIPGMTPTSLVPKAAATCGINYEMLTEIILNCASLKL